LFHIAIRLCQGPWDKATARLGSSMELRRSSRMKAQNPLAFTHGKIFTLFHTGSFTFTNKSPHRSRLHREHIRHYPHNEGSKNTSRQSTRGVAPREIPRPIQSVCMGLAFKSFYAIYWKIHGQVSLFEPLSRWENNSLISHLLMRFALPWMKRAGHIFSYAERSLL
jgi:hypothetical protein